MDFDDDDEVNDSPLPYEYDIFNAKTDETNKDYIGALDNYVSTEIMFPVKFLTTTLTNTIKFKFDNQDNPIHEEDKNRY